MAARKPQAAKKTTQKTSPSKSSASSASAKKAPAKRIVTKKVVAKKSSVKAAKPVKTVTTVKKTATKLSLVKTGPISVGKKAFTKAQFVSTVAEQTGVTKKEVELVLSSVSKVIEAHLKKQGPKTFAWPGLFKIVVVKKPATPKRWGINPFTKEKMEFQAKPATQRVRVRPLKGLKEMVI